MLLNSLTWELGGERKNGSMFYDTKGFMLCGGGKSLRLKKMFYKANFKVFFYYLLCGSNRKFCLGRIAAKAVSKLIFRL